MNSERIQEIQKETGYPDSVSVQQALLKVWNETAQVKADGIYVGLEAKIADLEEDMRRGYSESVVGIKRTELGGKLVELQLRITDDEDDFCPVLGDG